LSNEASVFPSAPKLEETYLDPADCQESPYAYTRNYEAETYALPYNRPIEELYTKPIPKSQRKNPPLYSVVLPKSKKREVTDTEIAVSPSKNKPRVVDETIYATVINQGSSEGNYADPNYTNVFNNEPYVNSKSAKDTSEYAEPSYCELNR
jgi:hypothetical protein